MFVYFIVIFIYLSYVLGELQKGGRVPIPQCEGLLLSYWGRAAGVLAFEEYVLKKRIFLERRGGAGYTQL